MSKTLFLTGKHTVRVTLFCAALSFNATAFAAAIGIDTFDTTNQINSGEQITASTRFGLNSSYSDNPFLNNSAWGSNGTWFTFMNLSVTNVTISVAGDTEFAPGLTVWSTGVNEFDGGTINFAGEISTAGFNTPDSFNATGIIGDAGTLWMADGQGGNAIETLGYAVSGTTHLSATTGWGEDIVNGAHDVSLTNSFETGITGSVNANTVSLTFDDLAVGWYALYIGGTDDALAGGNYDLTVTSAALNGDVSTAVPEPASLLLLLTGLYIAGRIHKQPGRRRIRRLPPDANLAPYQ